jgi:hypothetical protein
MWIEKSNGTPFTTLYRKETDRNTLLQGDSFHLEPLKRVFQTAPYMPMANGQWHNSIGEHPDSSVNQHSPSTSTGNSLSYDATTEADTDTLSFVFAITEAWYGLNPFFGIETEFEHRVYECVTMRLQSAGVPLYVLYLKIKREGKENIQIEKVKRV